MPVDFRQLEIALKHQRDFRFHFGLPFQAEPSVADPRAPVATGQNLAIAIGGGVVIGGCFERVCRPRVGKKKIDFKSLTQSKSHVQDDGAKVGKSEVLRVEGDAVIVVTVVALLSKSLAEEENADQLLNQIARSLMSVANMPAAIEQSVEQEG